VGKRQRRLIEVEDMVISLVAKGLTTGAVQAHLAEIYGAEVSRQTISTSTDNVLDGVQECVSGSGRAGRTGREPRNVHEESSVTYGRGESGGGTPQGSDGTPVRHSQVTALCASQAPASDSA
jgi:Transposase, Mutator family